MTCTLFQIGKRDGSTMWDVRDLAKSVKLDTDSDFSAGTLTFDLMEVNEGFVPHDGDVVQFQWDKVKVFYGYIFKVDYKADETFSCTAYDKRRYLKNQDSRIWPVGTLSQRFDAACKYVGVTHKVVNATTYKLPAKVSDGVSFFDMLQEDVKGNKYGGGGSYIITDNYGTVELHKLPIKDLGIMVGDKSGQVVTDWEYDRSIDDTANIVKVVKSSQKDQKTTTTTAKSKKKQTKAEKAAAKKQKAAAKAQSTADQKASDARVANINKVYGTSGASDPLNTIISSQTAKADSTSEWGGLQVVEKVSNDKMNAAQMKAQANALLKEKNVETKSMKLTLLGSLDYAVGNQFVVQISSLSDIGISNRKVMITKATQNFDPTSWTTDVEVTI